MLLQRIQSTEREVRQFRQMITMKQISHAPSQEEEGSGDTAIKLVA